MGKRGPAPMPTNVKVLRGERRPSRLNGEEPPATKGAPPQPAWLSWDDWKALRAAEHWTRLEPELLAMGVLSTVDDGVLSAYCEALAEAELAMWELAENGYVVFAPSGYPQPSPWVGIKNKALERVAKFGAQLGLSASARSSIRVKDAAGSEAPESNPFAALLAARRA